MGIWRLVINFFLLLFWNNVFVCLYSTKLVGLGMAEKKSRFMEEVFSGAGLLAFSFFSSRKRFEARNDWRGVKEGKRFKRSKRFVSMIHANVLCGSWKDKIQSKVNCSSMPSDSCRYGNSSSGAWVWFQSRNMYAFMLALWEEKSQPWIPVRFCHVPEDLKSLTC